MNFLLLAGKRYLLRQLFIQLHDRSVLCIYLYYFPFYLQIKVGNVTEGREVLRSHGLDFDSHFYWISVGALLGFTILFDFGFVLALSYIKRKPCLS